MSEMIDCIHNMSDEERFACEENKCHSQCDNLCSEYRNRLSNEEQLVLYKKAIELYGTDMQVNVAMEEMGELIQALVKYKRDGSIQNLAHIWEEIADVQIMIDQLKIIYNGEDKVKNQMMRKQKRLKSHIEKKLKEGFVSNGKGSRL